MSDLKGVCKGCNTEVDWHTHEDASDCVQNLQKQLQDAKAELDKRAAEITRAWDKVKELNNYLEESSKELFIAKTENAVEIGRHQLMLSIQQAVIDLEACQKECKEAQETIMTWKTECLEMARLNGMGGSREAKLMAKLEAAESIAAAAMELSRREFQAREAAEASCAALSVQLSHEIHLRCVAESSCAAMREALQFVRRADSVTDYDENGEVVSHRSADDIVEEALKDTAGQALLDKVSRYEAALNFYATCNYHPADMEGDGDGLVDFGTKAREALRTSQGEEYPPLWYGGGSGSEDK